MRMCLFVSTAVDSDEDVQQGDTKHDHLTGFEMVKLNMGFNHQLHTYIYIYLTVYIYIYIVGYYQSIVDIYCWEKYN